MNFRLKKYREDHEGALKRGSGGWNLSSTWDVTWHDEQIVPEFLSKMLPFQKVNRFPGMQVLTRKTQLARGLTRMAAIFGAPEYDFFPRTWAMPIDLLDFRSHWFHNNKDTKGNRRNQTYASAGPDSKEAKRPVTYVVKPEDMSNSRGMFLSRNLDQILAVALH